ncbi:MAG: malectin domain-containing carbohydrate-binding protein [Candidatus Sulfotelmatobacter sp.]
MDLRNAPSPSTQLLNREHNGLSSKQPSLQYNFFWSSEQNKGKIRAAIPKLSFVGLTLVVLLLSASTVLAQNSTIFGPNVYVFTTSDSVSSINTTLNTLNANTQFSTNRYAVLFEPGTYTGVESEVGYYESVAGLGETPTATTISDGYLTSNQTDSNGNLTTNFWRSIENMSINAIPAGDTYLQWGVSQGAAFRRMYVHGAVELTNTDCGEASGGFIANSQVTGTIESCSQQQWYTRNSSIGSWTGNLWNMVFSGVSGAPAQSNPFGSGTSYTVLAATPVSREKPFLYMDSSGNYWVFSPAYGTNTSGTTWASGGVGSGEAGTSLAISTFYIATPSSTLAQINAALASGENLILTPGIYTYSGSINVTNANTVVLGLGYANLNPQTGTAAITVADVGGVQIAGLLIDAGPVNSPVLFQVGVAGASRVSHASNPTSINDVFFRIGGAVAGTATESMEIDSDNVILDNIWAWRADHGTDASWTGNVAMNGLVVNGDNVTALGLAVEHYEAAQVQWNGEGGETIFYQSEMPYDVPSESAWMDGTIDGYASYIVSPAVTTHQAYGLGVYSYFNQGVDIIANSGILAPVANGVKFTDSVSVFLAGSGQINYNIASDSPTTDNAGTTADSASYISYITSWGGTSGNCTAAPSVPGTPSATATSSSQISLTWGASSAGSSCTVSYSVFRSTTSGFTPSSSNLIASSLTSASYGDTGLAASTAYYYIVEALDGDGTSAASAQATATTESGGGSCTTVAATPVGLTATASSSSSIVLTWTPDTPPANCTVTYSIYGSTTSGFTPSSSTLIVSGLTSASYTNTGLAASTTYYYVVVAVDAEGSSAASAQTSATTQSGSGSCTTVPSAPTGLMATASSSSAIGLSWTAVTPPANCTINSYTVYGSTTSGFTPGSGNLITSGLTSTSYSNTGLTASTTYYYVVEAVDADGSSAASAQASAETEAAGAVTEVVAINSEGPAVSNSGGGDYSFVADEDFTGGGAATPTTASISTTAAGANAAPMAVYQTQRDGVFTYTIPGLTAGAQYTVLLHFAEIYFTAGGDREYNVAINGTTMLTNFDQFAAAGGKNIAVVKTFTATANSSGQIVIAFTDGAVNQPSVAGLEIRTTSSCATVPSAPTGLTATASSSSVIGLTWTAVTPPANCSISSYSVYRSTTSGFTPSSSNLIASGVTGTTYSNTGLAASTTYYYVVEAVDADGTSAASAQASAETSAASCTTVPSAPTGLTATASSSSVIGLSWTAVTPPANCTISSYSVYGSTTSGFTPGSGNLIASGLTGTTYSNTGLAASTTYYYVVEAVDADGSSAASAQASATTQAASGSSEVVAIACGGPAESNSSGGDYSFVADEDFSGGGDNSPVTATINLTQPGANAAPMGVYQHGRAGVSTYTIPGLTAGSTYTVLLHFAETYFTAAGDREFNVAINGTSVLTNLDIYGTVGKDAALLETFNTTANSSGDIVIAFTDGAANQPVVMGIEVRTN